MKTLEIKPGEGGADAEQFAEELTDALASAFERENAVFRRANLSLILSGQTPSWL